MSCLCVLRLFVGLATTTILADEIERFHHVLTFRGFLKNCFLVYLFFVLTNDEFLFHKVIAAILT